MTKSGLLINYGILVDAERFPRFVPWSIAKAGGWSQSRLSLLGLAALDGFNVGRTLEQMGSVPAEDSLLIHHQLRGIPFRTRSTSSL